MADLHHLGAGRLRDLREALRQLVRLVDDEVGGGADGVAHAVLGVALVGGLVALHAHRLDAQQRAAREVVQQVARLRVGHALAVLAPRDTGRGVAARAAHERRHAARLHRQVARPLRDLRRVLSGDPRKRKDEQQGGDAAHVKARHPEASAQTAPPPINCRTAKVSWSGFATGYHVWAEGVNSVVPLSRSYCGSPSTPLMTQSTNLQSSKHLFFIILTHTTHAFKAHCIKLIK